jgi:hypothetical protein
VFGVGTHGEGKEWNAEGDGAEDDHVEYPSDPRSVWHNKMQARIQYERLPRAHGDPAHAYDGAREQVKLGDLEELKDEPNRVRADSPCCDDHAPEV